MLEVTKELDSIRNDLQKRKNDYFVAGKKLILEGFKQFMELNPNIEGIRWSQGTPTWNDGDPCYFLTGDIYLLFKKLVPVDPVDSDESAEDDDDDLDFDLDDDFDEDEDEDEDFTDCFDCDDVNGFDDLYNLIDKNEEVVQQFGDPATVTYYRGKDEVEVSEHDNY